MKKKIINILLFITLVSITVLYTYYFRMLTDDELYNYGFSYNIINGLLPYKDFSMIIPPIFSYLLAIFLKVFGSKLIIYHIVIALLISITTFISYYLIGKKAITLYLLMLLYPYIGYNIFPLCLLFILFFIDDKKSKYNKFLEPIIISLMFLSKQTLALLIIPSIIFSKNKKQTIAIYLLFIFIFLMYLIINGTTFFFLDYCLFGMFDFAKENSTSINLLLIFEIFIILMLIIAGIKTRRKDIFFCLLFQVITFPIVDIFHFAISFVPVTYLLLKFYKNRPYITMSSFIIIFTFFITYNYLIIKVDNNYSQLYNYPEKNFMHNRVTSVLTDDIIKVAESYITKYNTYTIYTLGNMSYLIKLNCEIPITKYDLINNGNMGYNGAYKYIKELDSYCSKNKCMYLIKDAEVTDKITSQANIDILKYVQNNYYKIYSSNIISIYIN